MKTIFQLAKIARRAPRRKRGWQHKLKKAQTPKQREYCLGHIQLCERNMRIIEGELALRNVGEKAYRRTMPKKQQRALGMLPAVA